MSAEAAPSRPATGLRARICACGATHERWILDLYCCEGGAAVGYHEAGFGVVGMDLDPQPRYPFEFHRGDATDRAQWPAGRWDATHGSPPCQDYSRHMRHLARAGYPRLIDRHRELAQAEGVPYIIENVPGSPLPAQPTLDGAEGVELCGTMFGLSAKGLAIRRHRLFETSFPVGPPRGCDHRAPTLNPFNHAGRALIFAVNGRDDPERLWREAMGVPWMGFFNAREAVPPAYTRYLGGRLLAHLTARGARR